MALSNEQVFTVQAADDFAKYADREWLNVGQDERGWYVTNDPILTLNYMRREGWNVSLRDHGNATQMMPDDSIRTYFDVTI